MTDVRKLVHEVWKIFKILALNTGALFFLLLQLSWNAGNLGYSSFITPAVFRPIMWITHLDQVQQHLVINSVELVNVCSSTSRYMVVLQH